MNVIGLDQTGKATHVRIQGFFHYFFVRTTPDLNTVALKEHLEAIIAKKKGALFASTLLNRNSLLDSKHHLQITGIDRKTSGDLLRIESLRHGKYRPLQYYRAGERFSFAKVVRLSKERYLHRLSLFFLLELILTKKKKNADFRARTRVVPVHRQPRAVQTVGLLRRTAA